MFLHNCNSLVKSGLGMSPISPIRLLLKFCLVQISPTIVVVLIIFKRFFGTTMFPGGQPR